jgi:hypothetical protein
MYVEKFANLRFNGGHKTHTIYFLDEDLQRLRFSRIREARVRIVWEVNSCLRLIIISHSLASFLNTFASSQYSTRNMVYCLFLVVSEEGTQTSMFKEICTVQVSWLMVSTSIAEWSILRITIACLLLY